MLLAGTPLAAPQALVADARNCERRDSQLDSPYAPGRAAPEETGRDERAPGGQ
jgi:hypothetical protein